MTNKRSVMRRFVHCLYALCIGDYDDNGYVTGWLNAGNAFFSPTVSMCVYAPTARTANVYLKIWLLKMQMQILSTYYYHIIFMRSRDECWSFVVSHTVSRVVRTIYRITEIRFYSVMFNIFTCAINLLMAVPAE